MQYSSVTNAPHPRPRTPDPSRNKFRFQHITESFAFAHPTIQSSRFRVTHLKPAHFGAEWLLCADGLAQCRLLHPQRHLRRPLRTLTKTRFGPEIGYIVNRTNVATASANRSGWTRARAKPNARKKLRQRTLQKLTQKFMLVLPTTSTLKFVNRFQVGRHKYHKFFATRPVTRLA